MRGFSTYAAAIQSGWWFMDDPTRNCPLEIFPIPSLNDFKANLAFQAPLQCRRITKTREPWPLGNKAWLCLTRDIAGWWGAARPRRPTKTEGSWEPYKPHKTGAAGLHTAWGAQTGTPTKIRKLGLSIPGKYLCTRILQVRENGLAIMQASGIAHATEVGQIGTKWLGKGPERPWTGKTNPQWIRNKAINLEPVPKVARPPN
ncbi:hypothetical protein F5144DRAFT_155210 [Chaetomium tenue]|uniref:Uncharacterized protein n=1 Tax=Chaetomium tenue TaxID=1854479 RepID=A0ACB7PBU7_9PEZI|nr:hypothetical protein F5144DRAFT_155210 [Chaetomium globosum]